MRSRLPRPAPVCSGPRPREFMQFFTAVEIDSLSTETEIWDGEESVRELDPSSLDLIRCSLDFAQIGDLARFPNLTFKHFQSIISRSDFLSDCLTPLFFRVIFLSGTRKNRF